MLLRKESVTIVLVAETSKPTAFSFLSDSIHEENLAENYEVTMNTTMLK